MIPIERIINLSDRYEAFYQLIDYYKLTSDSEREEIRNSWDYNKEWIYPHPEILATDLPNDRSCEERILASLIADTLQEHGLFDIRDVLVGWCVIYHSAIEVGMDATRLFEEVAKISGTRFAMELIRFINRSEEDKSLKAFHVKRVAKGEEVRFTLGI